MKFTFLVLAIFALFSSVEICWGQSQILLEHSLCTSNFKCDSPPIDLDDSLSFWVFEWDNGLNYKLNSLMVAPELYGDLVEHYVPDVTVQGRVGASLYLDGGYISDISQLNDQFTGTIRRARIYTTGTYNVFFKYDYKVQLAVEKGSFFINDFYVRHYFDDTEYLKLGYFDPPMSLEALSSIGDYALMELPTVVSALAPGMRLGLQYGGQTLAPEFIWAANVSTFGQSHQNEGATTSSPLQLTGRLVYLPEYAEQNSRGKLTHLAISFSYLLANSGELQFHSRPESFLSPFVLDTGRHTYNSSQSIGLEFLDKNGSLTHQAEFIGTAVDYDGLSSATNWGAYYQIAKQLNGDYRKYNLKRGVLVGVENSEETNTGYVGVVELAGRISHADLNSTDVKGGKQTLSSLGLNWFINRNLAIRTEYVFGRIDSQGNKDNPSILQGRLQFIY